MSHWIDTANFSTSKQSIPFYVLRYFITNLTWKSFSCKQFCTPVPLEVDGSDQASLLYLSKNESCKYKPENSVANVTAFWSVVNKEDGLMTTVATVGPVSAAVDASLNSFQFYKKGQHVST